MKLKLVFVVAALGLGSVNSMAACYTVYDRANSIVYNSQTPPVDMSRQLRETVPVAFPGGTMIFGQGNDCPREAPVRTVASPPPAKPSPLLTNRRIADAMKVPYTVLASGAALITQPTTMTAGVTVLPVLSPVIAPVVIAQRSARPDIVITEMHNPPLTMVQQGGMVVSALR